MTDPSSASEGNLHVLATSTNGIVVLSVRGELDVFTAPQLSCAIALGIKDARTALIVDFSALDFMASIGMKVLLDADRAASRSDETTGRGRRQSGWRADR